MVLRRVEVWRELREGWGSVERGYRWKESVTEEVLSLRIAIKLNRRGEQRVSVLFTVIKRTSGARHFFFFPSHAYSWLTADSVRLRDRRRMGTVHCFLAIIQYLLYPHALSVQLYATSELTKRVCVCDGSCHSC